MGTTIFPLANGGPLDDDYGPIFPRETGRGMAMQSRLLEASRKIKSPKKIIQEAEGVKNRTKLRSKVKMGEKPKNLHVPAKGKKRGAFGEAYSPTSAGKKESE